MLDQDIYEGKDPRYFDGAREDFVDVLPVSIEARILEIGCGNGNTGALALAKKKCATYVGVELFESAARNAKTKLSSVIVGDVESIELPFDEEYFDVLILSEVLEHLIDPSKLLRRLNRFMKPGAIVLASSPNVSHYRVILMLLKGRWDLTDDGVMDRTHLRWFTPSSFAKMFESSGYHVAEVEPLTPFNIRIRFQVALLMGRGRHLFFKQIKIKAIKL